MMLNVLPIRAAHCVLCLATLASVILLASPASGQVDTPAAREARQALRQVRKQYGDLPEWNTWAAVLNLPDLQFELLAGERGEPAVLHQAVRKLSSGRLPQFSEPLFTRLATALNVRARELAPIAEADWPSECVHLSKSYVPVTADSLERARKHWVQRLDEFEAVFPKIRERGSQWNAFLFWPESRELASPARKPLPTGDLLDRLETRWTQAPSVWDEPALYEASLAAQEYIRQLRSFLAGETRKQHAAAWRELGQLLEQRSSDPTVNARIAAAVATRESLGESSQLTASIRRELSRPNLVLQMDRQWLQSQFTQQIREPYQINGVFAGTRSIGSGELVGTMRAKILPSSAVGRLQLLFYGTSTGRASGSRDRVEVTSRATTRIAATKPFQINERGLTPETALAGAVTHIVYESIYSPGFARRRNRAIDETYALRPQAERESAEYARRSILKRVNEEAAKVSRNFNASYHSDFRNPRLMALRPSPIIRVRSAEGKVRWQCLLEGPLTFGAPEPPETVEGSMPVVLNLAASALEEQANVALAGRELSGQQLLERMGRASAKMPADDETPADSKDSFKVTFAADPCDFRFEEGAVHARLYITKFDSAGVRYQAMTVDVAYQPQVRDGHVVFARQGRVRATPLATAEGHAPKLSGRQQTLKLAVERKLAKVLTPELEGNEVKLPLTGGEVTMQAEFARLNGSWLQIGLARKSPSKSAAPTGRTVRR